MNSRERFLEIARMGQPEKWYLWPEGSRMRGLEHWKKQGQLNGIETKENILNHFRFDRLGGGSPGTFGIDIGPLPAFEEVVLEEDEQYIV